MSLFDRVKKYYDMHIYHEAEVAAFVRKGKLTAEQYEEITGEPYVGGGE